MADKKSGKRITQETFDEVVNENMEEFDMERNEAIKDAIKQFKSQGVDLANIDLTGGEGKEEMLAAIDLIVKSKGTSTSSSSSTSSVVFDSEMTETSQQLLQGLRQVAALCNPTDPLGRRNQYLMNTHGGLNAIHEVLAHRPIYPSDVILAAFGAIVVASKNHEENRDFFEPGGSKRLCDILSACLDKEDTIPIANKNSILVSGINLARSVAKSENVKFNLMQAGLGVIITNILTDSEFHAALANATKEGIAMEGESSSVLSSRSAVLESACLTMRGLCIHDDLRREMSCAHDNGKFFINAPQVVPSLMKLSASFKLFPGLASAALAAARNLITTEEAVQVMTQNGAMTLPSAILSYPDATVNLVRSLIGVMRNLCADDMRKDRLVADGTLQLLVSAMSKDTYSSDAILMEHAIACLAAMSLRNPSNATRIVECGSVDLIVKAMRNFQEKSSALLRQGCLCIRNIAARCVELRGTLLDAGVESVLRDAGRHQDVIDEAYAALRDLECEVQFVKFNAEGGVFESAYDHFGGEGKKLNFNPVYDDTADIQARVQNEAQAPFKADGSHNDRSDHHMDHDHDHEHEHAHQHHTHEHDESCCSSSSSASASGHSHDHSHAHGV